jgi:uncharacterized membrane protein
MRTPANIAGHPIHPMLVTIPIGLWIFSLVADLMALRSGAPQNWAMVAYYSMIGGIVGALAAALPGLVDLLSLKDNPIQKTALIHMTMNLTIVALYVVNAWLRYTGTAIGGTPLALSVLAVAMLAVSGWLGGKMVYLGGVGVDTEAAMASGTAQRQDRSRDWTGYAGSSAANRRGATRDVGREDHAFARGGRAAGEDIDKSNTGRER